MQLRKERTLLSERELHRVLRRQAVEIVERAGGLENLLLVGIHTGGVHIAKRIQRLIGELEGSEPPLGMVDIALYRDDAFMGLPKPIVGQTSIPTGTVDNQTVVLIDDVLFTGRTVRSALDALMTFGRPKQILLSVVIDRGLRELPIHADCIGTTISTTREHVVEVELSETGASDAVVLYRRIMKDEGA
mgnify:CR=1 FL=1